MPIDLSWSSQNGRLIHPEEKQRLDDLRFQSLENTLNLINRTMQTIEVKLDALLKELRK